MEKYDETEIDIDHLTKSILLYGCFEYHVNAYITYLMNKGHDYKKYINLHNIHLYVMPSNQLSILKYIVDKYNLDLTPYSLEIYISSVDGYNYRGDIIKYILGKCTEKITQKTKDILNNHIATDHLAYNIIVNDVHKKRMLKENGFRRIRKISQYHYFDFESYEVVDHKILEEEIINIAECKENAITKNNYYENYDYYDDDNVEPIAGEGLEHIVDEEHGSIINELEEEFDLDSDSDSDTELDSDSDSDLDISSESGSDMNADFIDKSVKSKKAKNKKIMTLN
jgi:hypothetical protein